LKYRPGGIISGRNEIDQLCILRASRAAREGRALCRAEDITVEKQRLMLPQPFIA
jgi:hypothetical protein